MILFCQATSGMNGAGTRTQAAMGNADSAAQFLEDTVRSATGVKEGPVNHAFSSLT